MRFTRRQFAALLTVPAGAQTNNTSQVILRAMKDEIERSKQLRVVNKDPLYHLEYTLDDAEIYSVAASFGGLLRERRNRLRIPQVTARVGSPEFDNGNYVFSDFFGGSRFDPDQFPLDDSYEVLRHAWWLATDRAYKTAIDAIGRKRAALRNVTLNDKLPDFTPQAAVEAIGDTTRERVNETEWKARVLRYSALLNAYPELQDSSIDFESVQSVSYFANSEGTVAANPDRLCFLRVLATAQAADGMRLRDSVTIQSSSPSRLSTDAELRQAVRSVGENLRALTKASAAESYSGPVLFEGMAAAQMFGEVLGSALVAQRRPVSDPNRPLPTTPGPFDGRIGSRVLPASFDVVDDPLQTTFRGRELAGSYPIDVEGVVPKPLAVIEKGILKALLATRQPTKDTSNSNGRARLPGAFGAKAAGITNLFVKASDGVDPKELRAQFLKLVESRGKPFGLLIRKMDFPSTAPLGELRRLVSGQERPVSLPLLAYHVYPDGREELVRGLRFRGFSARSLRDIQAAGSDENFFDFLGNLAPFSVVGGGGFVFSATVAAPSVLFEDLELDRFEQDLPQTPIAPPPPLSVSQ
jgi:TldD protein